MENSKKIFEMALNLSSSWFIKEIDFKPIGKTNGQLDIYIDFKKGSKFLDDAGQECSVYDTVQKKWQHLDFFQHTCYLHARVPRIKTSTGQIRLVQVPWSRPNSGFTLLFEAFALILIKKEMPVNKAASILKVYAPRIWTIFNHWVSRAREKDAPLDIIKVGIDETSSKKGHKYVTLSVDLDKRQVVHVCPGKDEQTVKNFHNYLESKKINPNQITHFAMDMSPAFISGVGKYFPNANIVFDRFHIKKLLNEALDKLRKSERREHQELKNLKWVFLKKPKDLSYEEKHRKFESMESFPKLGEGVRLVELFDDFFDFDNKEQAAAYLAYWCDLAEESGIPPFQKFTHTIKAHWSGILNYTETKINNGILEGINSKIQLAKRRARGFRNINNFINMIYFVVGDLQFDYPLDLI